MSKYTVLLALKSFCIVATFRNGQISNAKIYALDYEMVEIDQDESCANRDELDRVVEILAKRADQLLVKGSKSNWYAANGRQFSNYAVISALSELYEL